MRKVSETAAREIANLRSYVDLLRDDLKAVDADPRYAPEYKKQLAEDARTRWQREAEDIAATYWKRTVDRAKSAAEAVKVASDAKDRGINWSRIQVLTDEYRAELSRPGRFLTPGESPLQRVATIADRARAQGDVEALRAIRIAASERLADTSEDPGLRAKVSAAFDRDSAAEWAEVRKAEQKQAAAEDDMNELYSAALEVERSLYNLPEANVFSSLTGWQRRVFGETLENQGFIVDKTNAVGG